MRAGSDKRGGLEFGDRGHAIFIQWLLDKPGSLLKIIPVLPESDRQRRFFEGAVCPAHRALPGGPRSSNRRVRQWLKIEFNGELVAIDDKVHRIGKSTKGREALNAFPERVIGWLIDNYTAPAEALTRKSSKSGATRSFRPASTIIT